MAIPSRSDDGLSNTPAVLQRNYWNLPSGIARNVSVLFKFPLPSRSNLPKPAVNGRKAVEKPLRRISMQQLSRMQKCFLTSCVNAGLRFRPGFSGILPSRLMGPASPRLRPNSLWRLSRFALSGHSCAKHGTRPCATNCGRIAPRVNPAATRFDEYATGSKS